jgi:tRNA (mo5U34)-methyltransferase
LKWCHTFPELGISGSHISKEDEDFILSAVPTDLSGKSVLDLASFDGFYSYEAIKRGAKYVVALDNGMGEEILGGPDQGSGSINMSFPNDEERQKAFDRQYAKYKLLNANINLVPMNVEDMDKLIPDFDVIFCFGLYYHIKDFYGLFEKCYKKCKQGGIVIIEGALLDTKEPVVYMVGPQELHNDPTNFWVPSVDGLCKTLWRIGFSGEIIGTRHSRILMKAIKK